MKEILKSTIIGLVCLASFSCSDVLERHQIEKPAGDLNFNAIVEANYKTKAVTGYTDLPKDYVVSIVMNQMKDGVNKVVKTHKYKVTAAGSNLVAVDTTHYWHSSTVEYAFSAFAGSDIILADQSTSAYLIKADSLSGFAGLKDGVTPDTPNDALVYMKANKWSNADGKAIPLYLKHEHAMISVILIAGEGVSQTSLAYKANNTSLRDSIYSYSVDGKKDVIVSKPYSVAAKTEETLTANNTTKFVAIVKPYDYYTNRKLITRVVLNNQNYSFYAENDLETTDKENVYNLKAGDHLQLKVTIGRDGRIIRFQAQQKDWEIETNTDILTDDFGHGSDPYVITDKKKLFNFINDEDLNAKGNVAIVSIPNITVDTTIAFENLKVLNATLNLNGHKITTSQPLFKEIGETGSLKNGTIEVTNAGNPYGVASVNNGLIDRITVSSATQFVSKAAFVETNNGIINNCNSNIKVYGRTDYIGGITSIQNIGALISNCTVYGKVYTAPENTTTTLGGIAGKIIGNNVNKSSITNCLYDYGITYEQTGGAVRNNIVGEIANPTGVVLSALSWPTKDVENTSYYSNDFLDPYDDVFDCMEEFKDILESSAANDPAKSYRIAADFELDDTWGNSADWSKKVLTTNIEGNNKTITTNGSAIFKTINGAGITGAAISNLNVVLNKSIESSDFGNPSDCISGFAHTLMGATIENINVRIPSEDDRENIVIKGCNPAGIIATCIDGSKILACSSNVSIISKTSATNGTVYAGGIVSQMENSEIKDCWLSAKATITKDDAVNGVSVFAGGIIGGLGWRSSEDTKNNSDLGSIVEDCTCFVTKSGFSEKTGEYVYGGIVGLLTYTGLKQAGIGNWWQANVDGVGYELNPTNPADGSVGTIGVRNSVIPDESNK